MTIPKVDTFEHDIASEIKEKEASVVSIATASGDVQDAPLPPTPTSPAILIASILFFICILVVGVLGYMYYTKESTQNTSLSPVATSTVPSTNLVDISPSLDQAISTFVTGTTKTEYGYTLMLGSYSPVFAYMLKNESQYAEEVALSLGADVDTSTTSIPFIFTDITNSNQNIRVGTSGSSTVMYAFIGTNVLVLASTTEAILRLRTSVLIQ